MKKNITIITLSTVTVLGLAVGGFSVLNKKDTPNVQLPVISAPVTPQLRQDPELVAVMKELGLDYSKLNVTQVDTINNLGLSDVDAAIGEFYGNTINVKRGLTNDKLKVTLSHEYIHYVQSTQKTEAERFYPYMEQLRNSDPAFARLTQGYSAAAQANAESEAKACTEVPSSVLRANFVAFCNKYISRVKLGL